MELESFDNALLDPIADVQGSPDTRNISIDKVGIRGLRHPVALRDRHARVQHTVATFAMYVALPPHVKGTHMSRFVDLLNRTEAPIAVDNLAALLADMVARLNARSGDIEMEFPFFMRKHAPVSGVASLLDYHVTLRGHLEPDSLDLVEQVIVPVTSLCPCSKQISDYGAHNQRSHITVAVRTHQTVWLAELIELVERQASAELYGVLKRADEKYVTEHAYDNPKFVEDVVRDVAAVLAADNRIAQYRVSVENFESIHNHSAFARITHNKMAG